MCKRGDVVALESQKNTFYALGSGRAPETRVEYTLAKAASVSRDGIVKEVRLAGFPYDPGSKYQAHRVMHMHATKVLTISGDAQEKARRLFTNMERDAIWNSADEMRAAIMAA